MSQTGSLGCEICAILHLGYRKRKGKNYKDQEAAQKTSVAIHFLQLGKKKVNKTRKQPECQSNNEASEQMLARHQERQGADPEV